MRNLHIIYFLSAATMPPGHFHKVKTPSVSFDKYGSGGTLISKGLAFDLPTRGFPQIRR